MNRVSWTGGALRVTVAEPGPALVLLAYRVAGQRHSLMKSVPEGVGMIEVQMPVRPVDVSVETMDAGRFDTLYVHRPVLNAYEFRNWFALQGLPVVEDSQLHCTIAFSREKLYWNLPGVAMPQVIVPADNYRPFTHLGPKGALVQKFSSPALADRWQMFRDCGASWDFPGYQPHITITYQTPNVNTSNYMAYHGRIVLGPEVFAPLDENWTAKES